MELKYVMSSDSHIVEPYDLWTNALGDKHGDKVPQRVSEAKGVKGDFIFCGYDYNSVGGLRQENAGNTPDSIAPVETGNCAEVFNDYCAEYVQHDPKCPSGDFMCRMNRLSGAPS